MLAKRIVPCLDMKEGRVVKGTQFVKLRDAGDPVELARFYDEVCADQLVFLDITASHEGRGTMLDVVRRTAKQVFIPFMSAWTSAGWSTWGRFLRPEPTRFP